MSRKSKHDVLNEKGLACTFLGFACDYFGRKETVKNNAVLSSVTSLAGLGLNVSSFVYYLRALGELGNGDHDEDQAFMDHLFSSVIFPTASAIHLAKSFKK